MSHETPYTNSTPADIVTKVGRYFDEVASEYDAILNSKGFSANALLQKELARVQDAERILELGAGTGRSTEVILNATTPRSVVAVDVSAAMLEQLRQRLGAPPSLVIARMTIDQFLAGTAEKLSSAPLLNRLRDRCNSSSAGVAGRRTVHQFGSGTYAKFDLVVAVALFHFLPKPHETIAAAGRVLRTTGQFMFTYDPYIPGHATNGEKESTHGGMTIYRRTPQDIEGGLLQNGFDVVADQPFVPQPTGNTEYQCRFVVAKKE